MKTKFTPRIFLVLIGAVVAVAWTSYSDNQPMAYVDTGQLMEQYHEMQEARKTFELKSAEWQAKADTLQQELELAIHDYERNRTSLTSAEADAMLRELETKRLQFVQYQQSVSQQAKEEDDKLTAEVFEKVNLYMREYGKQHHYKIIFGTTSGGNIIYADDAIDITQDVLNGLNESH